MTLKRTVTPISLVLLPMIIGILPIAFVSACAVAAEQNRREDYRNILHEKYPMFTAKQLRFSVDSYDAEGLVFGDLLVGDFNGDSIEDFAAALGRRRSKAEAEKDGDKIRRHILDEGIAVVCNGVSPPSISGARSTHECSYLAKPSLGSLEGELAFIEISSKDLPESELVSGKNCAVLAKKHDGLRTLALMHSASGYCIDLFYPVPGSSEYTECIYCEY